MRTLWNQRTEQVRTVAAKQGTQFNTMRDYGPLVTPHVAAAREVSE